MSDTLLTDRRTKTRDIVILRTLPCIERLSGSVINDILGTVSPPLSNLCRLPDARQHQKEIEEWKVDLGQVYSLLDPTLNGGTAKMHSTIICFYLSSLNEALLMRESNDHMAI